MRTLAAGATDTGRQRANNEDAFLVRDDLRLFAVADGVGGRAGGEIASALAVETLRGSVPDLLGAGDRTPPAMAFGGRDREPAALRSACSLANRGIREAVRERPELTGMGTTLTALLVSERRAHLLHIGDSRAYLFRSGALRQLSNDHTVVAEQVRSGVITPEQARVSAYRHVITRALGIEEEAAPELYEEVVRNGDVFLLCTDGLTEMVADDAIAAVLFRSGPEEAVRRLIDAANRAGGADNITAVVVAVREA